MKGNFPAQNEPAVDSTGRWAPVWFDAFVKYVAGLKPLSDIDDSPIYDAIALKSNIRRTKNLYTAAHAFSLSDVGTIAHLSSAATVVFTVPDSATVPFVANDQIDLLVSGGGKMSVVGAPGVTIWTPVGLTKVGNNGMATLFYDGGNTWYLNGYLVP